jgi:hypothetical protein
MDGLSRTYEPLLAGSYDCLDRIVVNAYFPMGHDAGGFRVWWRKLTGSEDTLDNAHLMRMAGRFSRRLRAWAAEGGFPSETAGWEKQSTRLVRKSYEIQACGKACF